MGTDYGVLSTYDINTNWQIINVSLVDEINHNEISNINSFYRWSYDYMAQNQVNNLNNQNNNIDRIKNETLMYFDIEFEKQKQLPQ